MFTKIFAVSAMAALIGMPAAAQEEMPLIGVVKNESCGCCGGWIARMQEEGFRVEAENLSYEELYDIKVSRGLSEELMSCHTASVAGYTVEGHVPAADIRRLLALAPDAIGIATPGMPLGSPGMGDGRVEAEPYQVFLVLRDGSREVFSSYPGA